MGLLDSLITDPTQADGGWLAKLLGVTPAQATYTPHVVPSGLVAPPTNSFATPQGLLGDSLIGRALRGGLAGFAGSVGYKGGAALGAGALAAEQNAAARRREAATNALMGQQYQQGQQGLISGNISNIFALQRVNAMLQDMGQPSITMDQLMANPDLVTQADTYANQAASNAPTAAVPPGGSGPRQSYVSEPGSIDAQLAAIAPLQWVAPEVYKAKLAAIQASPEYQTASEKAKAQGQIYNLRAGAGLYDSQGNLIGQGNPEKTMVMDPSGSGNFVPGVIYPGGEVGISTYAGAPSMGGSNNPGNIRSGPGGTFGKYPTMGAGVDAIDQNLQAYAKKGINTLAGVISTWAPPGENDTSTLIANAAKRLGVDPNQKLNLGDPNTRAQVALAIMQQENSLQRASASDSSVTGTNAGAAPVSKLGPYAEDTQKQWAQRRGELGDFVNSGVQAEQRFQALAEALKATQSGSFATDKAKIAAALHAVGIDLDPSVWGDPTQVQVAIKDSVQGVFSQIKFLVGSRVAAQEIQLLSTASANPDLQPGANLKIIAQGIGAIRYARDLYDALAAQKNPVDPNAFEIQFQRDHPLQGYVDAAEKAIGPLKGMQPAPTVKPEQVLQQAREAVAKGADKMKVQERLKQMGIDPALLD